MDNSAVKVNESGQSSVDAKGSVRRMPEVDRGKAEAVRSASSGVDAIATITEGADTVGRVSEAMNEDKSFDPGGGQQDATAKTAVSGPAKSQFDPAKIKAELLKNLPPEKVMRSQIEKEITKEIDYLHKKAMKMLRSPKQMNYFEMSNIMRKIRELRGILLMLVKASIEGIKSMWLRYVHGVMN